MSKHPGLTALIVAVAVLAVVAVAGPALSDRGGRTMKANLTGLDEVPAVSSTGSGEFLARIEGDAIEFTLTYQDLEGTSTGAAHIHLGQEFANGGIAVFLCGGGGRPACPPTAATISGTITEADVIGPTGQGIAAGEFGELIAAMRRGATYANVHTNKHTGGEIRGQIK